MEETKLAAQLYTIREFTQTLEDFRASMHKIREIGYKAVQVSGIGPISHEDVKAAVDAAGLTICITHVSFDYLRDDTEAAIAQHKLWECPNVAIGSMPPRYREAGLEGFIEFAHAATEIGKRLADAGLTFSYHNHSFEFVRFGRRTGLDIIYEESDPRYLKVSQSGAGYLLGAARGRRRDRLDPQAEGRWYAVEQDRCLRDPFESLRISYLNLRAMGVS